MYTTTYIIDKIEDNTLNFETCFFTIFTTDTNA